MSLKWELLFEMYLNKVNRKIPILVAIITKAIIQCFLQCKRNTNERQFQVQLCRYFYKVSNT